MNLLSEMLQTCVIFQHVQLLPVMRYFQAESAIKPENWSEFVEREVGSILVSLQPLRIVIFCLSTQISQADHIETVKEWSFS